MGWRPSRLNAVWFRVKRELFTYKRGLTRAGTFLSDLSVNTRNCEINHTRSNAVVAKDLQAQYEKALDSASISRELRPQFRKWLRFYLDFCSKYGHSPGLKSSLPLFMAKLASKNQPEAKRSEASVAMTRNMTSGLSITPAECLLHERVRRATELGTLYRGQRDAA